MVRHFLSRRWLLAFLGGAAILFGLAMLHPYPRQSLFGPTIRGKPRYYWETEARRLGDRTPSFAEKVYAWLGVKRQSLSFQEVFDDAEMVPVVVEMLDDEDSDVRHAAMTAITAYPSLQDRSTLPSLRKRLGATEIIERTMAARAIWRIDKDKRVLTVFLELLGHDAPSLRGAGIVMIGQLEGEVPELYPHLMAHAADVSPFVREPVMSAMKHFGKKGVPILTKGLSDPDVNVRLAAIEALEHLGPDATAAIPALEAALKDTDAKVRGEAPFALQAIDRERFKHLKGTRK